MVNHRVTTALSAYLAFVLAGSASFATAHELAPLPSGVEGYVSAMSVQPDQKIVIAGYFTAVNNQLRERIARLNADGSLDASWNPGVDGDVSALLHHEGIIYVGGNFATIGGEPRRALAAIDAETGQVTSWNPTAVGTPNGIFISSIALSTDGTTLYAAGYIPRIGDLSTGQVRDGFAAFDVATGALKPWRPRPTYLGGTPNWNASRLVVSRVNNPERDVIYVLGQFFIPTTGCDQEYYVSVVNDTSGVGLCWRAGANAGVSTLIVHGDAVYVGGGFTEIGGQQRNGLAALRAFPAGGNSAYSWNPDSNGTGHKRVGVVAYDSIFVTGNFTEIGGQPRTRVARLPLSPFGSEPMDWSPAFDDTARNMVPGAGGSVYLGGSFTQVNGVQRYGIARLSVTEAIFRNGFESP